MYDASQLYTTGVLNVVADFSADFDNDGDVDGDDLDDWQVAYGVNALADADRDGDSDGADFLAWQRQLGNPVNEAATSAVPEVATMQLFVSGALAM